MQNGPRTGSEGLEPAKIRSCTLTSLPIEVLAIIARCLDRSEAVALGRTARVFVPLVERAIWHHLDLSVREVYLVRYDRKKKKNVEDLDEKRNKELRGKLKTIMLRADERRWDMVESIHMKPRPRSLNAMIQILDFASPTLRELVISSSSVYDVDTPEDHELFDWKMIDAGISFTALTTLHWTARTILCAGVVPLICNCAPNLALLDIEYDEYSGESGGEGSTMPKFPSFSRETELRQVRIHFDGHLSEERESHLVDLVNHSPRLTAFSITFFDATPYIGPALMEALGSLKGLHCLSYHADPKYFGDVVEDAFPALHSFVIEVPSDPHDQFACLPDLAQVKIIHFDLSFLEYWSRLLSPSYPFDTSTQPIPPILLDRLRACTQLRYIRNTNETEERTGSDDIFTDLAPYETPDKFTGKVHSVRRGDSELLYVQLLMQDLEVDYKELVHWHEEQADDDPQKRILYTPGAKDYQSAVKRMDELVWRAFSDLDGMVVPLEVIQRMWEVERRSMDTWDGRNVEVGDEAWEVMMAWKRGVEAEMSE